MKFESTHKHVSPEKWVFIKMSPSLQLTKGCESKPHDYLRGYDEGFVFNS